MRTAKLFAQSSTAAIGVLAAMAAIAAKTSTLLSHLNYGKVNKTSGKTRTGQQYAKPRHLFAGTNADLPKSRQFERAEGRRELKAMEKRGKRRARDEAGKALSQRSGDRELRDMERARGSHRMNVHGMLAHSKGAGRLQRKRFA